MMENTLKASLAPERTRVSYWYSPEYYVYKTRSKRQLSHRTTHPLTISLIVEQHVSLPQRSSYNVNVS